MSNGLFDKIGDSLKGLAQVAAKGKEAYIISAEKRLHIEKLKISINELRRQKDEKMQVLAHSVYEQYTNGALQDPKLIELCQGIKMLQWQIDEHWTEVNNANAESSES